MRVICVKDLSKAKTDLKNPPKPEVGDIDVVVNIHKQDGETYLELERFGNHLAFISDAFSRLSDIDETALVNSKPELETA